MKETVKNIIYMARRFKTATVFNLVGLVLAFATFYLLMTQIIYQVTYNHGIDDYERLYRMESNFVYNEWQYSDLVPRPFAMALDSMPQVESYSLVTNPMLVQKGYAMVTFQKGADEVTYNFCKGNNTALSTLTDRVLDGSIEMDDSLPDGIVIPQSIAMAHFGTTQAVGREMTYVYHNPENNDSTETYPFVVKGVYEDFPEKSELVNCIYGNMLDEDVASLNANYKCIVKFKSIPADMGAFIDTLKQIIAADVAQYYQLYGLDDEIPNATASVQQTTIKFTPLKDSYFEHSSFTAGDSGYKGMLGIMRIVCLLVLAIAAINFLNFTLAESPSRVRGINTRNVLGASRSSLRLGIVAECVITSVLACLVALAVCFAFPKLPLVRQLTEGSLSLTTHWPLALLMLAIAVVIGIIAGVYPAFFATSFPSAVALKGRFALTPQGKRLRTVLMCLQLAATTLMLLYIGILFMQSRYIYTSSYGYDKDRILQTALPFSLDADRQEQLRHTLLSMPGVEGASFSSVPIGTTDGHNVLKAEVEGGHLIKYSFMNADHDYLRTMGIKVIEGRDFEPSDTAAVIINQAAHEQWDWAAIGTQVTTGIDDERDDIAVIVGVCENIRYGSTRISADQPFFIVLKENCNRLNVRVAADADREALMAQLNDTIRTHLDGQDIEGLQLFDDTLEQVYKNEFRYITQITIIAIICLIITLIGVFCMTMFETEYRRKEIGIRKVVGATTGEIIRMLCMHYVPLVLISFIVAAPLAWFFGRLTLDHFAQSTSISWWLFPLGLLLVGAVTLGTVVLQCWRTARENPINSISTE